MSHALFALAAALVINGEMPFNVSGAVIVQSSPGGRLSEAMATAPELRIRGRCMSSCAWAFSVNPNACFERGAVVGFHTFRDPGTGTRMENVNAYWLARVDPQVRHAIGDDVLTGDDLVILTADVLALILPQRRCGDWQ